MSFYLLLQTEIAVVLLLLSLSRSAVILSFAWIPAYSQPPTRIRILSINGPNTHTHMGTESTSAYRRRLYQAFQIDDSDNTADSEEEVEDWYGHSDRYRSPSTRSTTTRLSNERREWGVQGQRRRRPEEGIFSSDSRTWSQRRAPQAIHSQTLQSQSDQQTSSLYSRDDLIDLPITTVVDLTQGNDRDRADDDADNNDTFLLEDPKTHLQVTSASAFVSATNTRRTTITSSNKPRNSDAATSTPMATSRDKSTLPSTFLPLPVVPPSFSIPNLPRIIPKWMSLLPSPFPFLQQQQQQQQHSPVQEQQERMQQDLLSVRTSTRASSTASTITATSTSTTRATSPTLAQRTKPMPLVGYDALAIENYYNSRPLQVGWRLNSLGFPFLGWYMRLLWDKTLLGAKGFQRESIQRQRGQDLRNILIQSKSVALIKSGQALSLRPDLMRNQYWAEELGKLVDAVGAFSDLEAMRIIQHELQTDLLPRLQVTKKLWEPTFQKQKQQLEWQFLQQQKGQQQRGKDSRRAWKKTHRLFELVENDPILSLFEFSNDYQAIASASIGQVYKARIRPGPQLEAAIGLEQARIWGGKEVAIKVQRPDVEASASLDMYLLRRSAIWLSKVRGDSKENLASIADAFGMQLFGELDYVREANNCIRFREIYGNWNDVLVPMACESLTRRRVLVMDWVDGDKGPWNGPVGMDLVRTGLRCSVDQLMNTGLFHGDPHRGNLLKVTTATSSASAADGSRSSGAEKDINKLAFIDFGMVVDVDEDFRYSLFGLVIGLQNKDLPLVTENLLKLGFLKDTTQLEELIPRLRQAMKNATGGTGKASDVNFARLQAELDAISRGNDGNSIPLEFSTPPYFTVILRSLTILEGVALSVDPKFRLVRGAYPYVLKQLLSANDVANSNNSINEPPAALIALLERLLTSTNEAGRKEIKWERLRDLLKLAEKASMNYNALEDDDDNDSNEKDRAKSGRKTLELFAQFLTSRTGIFLKEPLVYELADVIDGMASMGEINLRKQLASILPGGRTTSMTSESGAPDGALFGLTPSTSLQMSEVDTRRIKEIQKMVTSFQDALIVDAQKTKNKNTNTNRIRLEVWIQIVQEISTFLNSQSEDQDYFRSNPLVLEELQSVIQLVAVRVLEIRGTRAMRTLLRV